MIATKELLNLFNVTYLANDETTKSLIVLADNEKEAMNKVLELRGSRDVYSVIEAKTTKELLNLFGVSKLSELLNAFIDFYNYRNTGDKTIYNDEIEIFIDSL